MGTIRIVRPDSVQFARTRDIVSDEVKARLPETDLDTDARTFHPGDESSPQLFEVKLAPNTRIEPHAHEIDQIMVVSQGEMIFGNQRCPVGTAVYIPGHTLYGFSSGPDGAAFLNFRPHQDFSYYKKDEFLAVRGER